MPQETVTGGMVLSLSDDNVEPPAWEDQTHCRTGCGRRGRAEGRRRRSRRDVPSLNLDSCVGHETSPILLRRRRPPAEDRGVRTTVPVMR